MFWKVRKERTSFNPQGGTLEKLNLSWRDANPVTFLIQGVKLTLPVNGIFYPFNAAEIRNNHSSTRMFDSTCEIQSKRIRSRNGLGAVGSVIKYGQHLHGSKTYTPEEENP